MTYLLKCRVLFHRLRRTLAHRALRHRSPHRRVDWSIGCWRGTSGEVDPRVMQTSIYRRYEILLLIRCTPLLRHGILQCWKPQRSHKVETSNWIRNKILHSADRRRPEIPTVAQYDAPRSEGCQYFDWSQWLYQDKWLWALPPVVRA